MLTMVCAVVAVAVLVHALFLVRRLREELEWARVRASVGKLGGKARKAFNRMTNTGNRIFNLLQEWDLKADRRVDERGYGIVVKTPKIHVLVNRDSIIYLCIGDENFTHPAEKVEICLARITDQLCGTISARQKLEVGR